MQNYGGDIAWVSYVPRDTIDSGLCGKQVAWTLYLDGTMVVAGKGAMYGYGNEYGAQPWAKYKNAIKSVQIKSGVTCIGSNAFRECTSTLSITRPSPGWNTFP